MIIQVSDMRNVRPIAQNIDNARVEVYIREAEHLDVIPIIGADLYQRLNEGAELTAEENILLDGGYYSCESGSFIFDGLKKSIAYLAYARFLRNNQVNVTPYGVVTKLGEESSTTEYRIVAAQAAEAQNIGEAMLSAAMKYWRSTGNSSESCRGNKGKRKFIAIGK